MLQRIGQLAVRRRRLVLVVTVLAFAIAGALGGGVAKHLSSGGFDDPSAQATRAQNVLNHQFHNGAPNLVVVVKAKTGSVDSAGATRAGNDLTRRIAAQPDVANVISYWSADRAAPLKSRDGTEALVAARITGNDNQVADRYKEIKRAVLSKPPEGVTMQVGGTSAVYDNVNHTVEQDLQRAEMIAIPITAVLLIIVFGSAVASLLPLAIGGLTVVGTFLVLRLLAMGTEVSIFALNLTTAMGLGLAIDYSLFVVSRYREELRAGFEPHDAVVRTVRTAGRTVAFSALTVAASLSAMLVFPLAFLRSFAYAGIAVAALAGLSAVVVLPALLAALGHRVNALTLWKRSINPTGEGFWHRTALQVMRRPWAFIIGVVAVLLVLGSPFLGLKLGYPDDRVLPTSAPSRQADEAIRANFTSDDAGAVTVVVPDLGTNRVSAAPAVGSSATSAAGSPAVADYARRLSLLPGVGRVDSITGTYLHGTRVPLPPNVTERFADPTGKGTWLSVVPTIEPMSRAGEHLVHQVRATSAPFNTLVGGQPAQMVDSNASMFQRLPIAIAIIAAITFVLLFLSFGSVVIPLKALVLNVLSLSATFGAMVWIFQNGHLSGLLGFTATGTLASTMPILMFCVAFGLSMDYEVFLLSRIKEEHDRGVSNELAVAHGLERTGRLVTALALLMAVVFLAIATSQVSFIKMFGIGLALAVLMDAFLIRGTLVPAFMRLAGDANWWAPAPLRRLYRRIGFQEHVTLEPATAPSNGAVAAVNAVDGVNGAEPFAYDSDGSVRGGTSTQDDSEPGLARSSS